MVGQGHLLGGQREAQPEHIARLMRLDDAIVPQAGGRVIGRGLLGELPARLGVDPRDLVLARSIAGHAGAAQVRHHGGRDIRAHGGDLRIGPGEEKAGPEGVTVLGRNAAIRSDRIMSCADLIGCMPPDHIDFGLGYSFKGIMARPRGPNR